jgi:hypothetical protein
VCAPVEAVAPARERDKRTKAHPAEPGHRRRGPSAHLHSAQTCTRPLPGTTRPSNAATMQRSKATPYARLFGSFRRTGGPHDPPHTSLGRRCVVHDGTIAISFADFPTQNSARTRTETGEDHAPKLPSRAEPPPAKRTSGRTAGTYHKNPPTRSRNLGTSSDRRAVVEHPPANTRPFNDTAALGASLVVRCAASHARAVLARPGWRGRPLCRTHPRRRLDRTAASPAGGRRSRRSARVNGPWSQSPAP